MRYLSLAASLAGLGVAVAAEVPGGVVEFDLVYPRHGEVYAPTAYMPVVVAIQNSELAKHIYPYFQFSVQANTAGTPRLTQYNISREVNWADASSNDTLFAYTFVKDFAAEGDWIMRFNMIWNSCVMGGDGKPTGEIRANRSSTHMFQFDTSKSKGQPINLLAANDQDCGLLETVVVEGIDEELRPLSAAEIAKKGFKTCNAVAPERGPGEGFPASKFCEVKFDDKVASEVAWELGKLCKSVEGGCPIATGAAASAKPSATGSSTSATGAAQASGSATQSGAGAAETSKSAAQRVAVAGVVGWAVGLGVVGGLLV